jgi:site-specific DNA recombinase
MKDTTIRKCALYARVSTDRQSRVEEGSLDTQFSLMERYVAFENDKNDKGTDAPWEIIDQYREEGKSGKDTDREEYQRMMSDIESGQVNTVIVHKIDRITRSLRDFYDMWETFENHNVHFVSLHEKFDTTNAIGRAMLKLILVFAELEREQTSERTQKTMLHRAEEGLFNGGFKILGYDRDPDNKGLLIVNEEEAKIVVEQVFSKCVELGSGGAVARHLNRIGVRKAVFVSRRGNERGGGAYSKAEVLRMLTNVTYLGKVPYGGEVYEGRQEAIVSVDLFNQVQEILARNRITTSNDRDPRVHCYLLQGLLRCGKCGAMMTPTHSCGRNKVKHFYYQCTRKARSGGTECDSKYIPAEAVEAYVLDELRRVLGNDEVLSEVIEQSNGQRGDRLKTMKHERRLIQRRLQDLGGRISQLLGAIETGTSIKSVEDRMLVLEGEKLSLEEELSTLDEEIERTETNTVSVTDMAKSYKDFPAILDELEQVGDRHTLREVLRHSVEVIDWHLDADDPTQGEALIMLFEEQLPSSKALTSAKETPGEPLLTEWCDRRSERLPVQNALRNDSRESRIRNRRFGTGLRIFESFTVAQRQSTLLELFLSWLTVGVKRTVFADRVVASITVATD